MTNFPPPKKKNKKKTQTKTQPHLGIEFQANSHLIVDRSILNETLIYTTRPCIYNHNLHLSSHHLAGHHQTHDMEPVVVGGPVMLVLKIWPQYKIGRILHLKLKENPAHEEEQKLYNKDICGKEKLLENLPQVVVKLA